MTRARAILRHPAVWLGLLLFAAAVWVGHRYSPPEPEAVVRTGNVSYGGAISGMSSGWSLAHGVSDDGFQLLTGFYEGEKLLGTIRRLQMWDGRSGQERTLPEWSGPIGLLRWLDRPLLDNPEGWRFLLDDSALMAVRMRLAKVELLGGEPHEVFPSSLRFSPDGRLLSYLSRNGKPVYQHGEKDTADGTVVEDARTGERVTFLPGVTEPLDLAPGGTAAATEAKSGDLKSRFVLWDLATASSRVEVELNFAFFSTTFSPEGRYVWNEHRSEIIWWDTATGRLVGHVKNKQDTALVANGAVLVVNPLPPRRGSRSYSSSRLCFWDVATGASLGHWDLVFHSNPDNFIGSAHPRYLCGQVHVEDTLTDRVVDRLERAFGSTPTRGDNQRFVVWDVAERREILRVPGQSAALSPNGQRLATIDDAGVVRVWQLPPPVPWGRILWQSALTAVIGGPTLVLFGRLIGHTWRSARATPLGRVGRWLLTGWRRWWTRSAGVVVLLAIFGGIGYAILAERARAEMRAAFEDIYATPGLTEAEVTARIGRPPDAGQVLPMAERGKGGGDDRGERVLRKWTRFGTELDVFFGPDGKEQGVYISDEPGLLDRLARWLGL